MKAAIILSISGLLASAAAASPLENRSLKEVLAQLRQQTIATAQGLHNLQHSYDVHVNSALSQWKGSRATSYKQQVQRWDQQINSLVVELDVMAAELAVDA